MRQPNPSTPPDTGQDGLVLLDNVTVVRTGGEVVLRGLSWAVHEGETWAIVGSVGSGKTTLAEVLLGRHRVEAGSIRWPLLDRLRAGGRLIAWPSEVIRHVAFKEESWRFSYSRHYYQQRFNFIEPHDDLTLIDFLRVGTHASDEAIAATTRRLGIEPQLELSLIKLSNGQTRRARIAKALLARPELLILDDPFLGLDVVGRTDVAALLGGLVRDGLRLVLITRPDAIPSWVTHVLELDHVERAAQPEVPRSTLHAPSSEPSIIELRKVNVVHGGRAILRDVSWTVRKGERWAIVGPNGSGKTTLLSLLAGDHPQAYANDIYLFGRPRGTGESIWDIKRQIGLVSPELHLYFSTPLTAEQTAATGFFDVLARRPTTPEQNATIRVLFEEFGIATLAGRPFRSLSTGEQRLVLLVRALVKLPPLLILDEPFQGLDARLISQARDWLDRRLRPEQTLLFVSHHAEEVPRTATRRLRLEEGRVVEVE